MKKKEETITLKLSREEAIKRYEELRSHDNVQLFLKVSDGREKFKELKILAQKLEE